MVSMFTEGAISYVKSLLEGKWEKYPDWKQDVSLIYKQKF